MRVFCKFLISFSAALNLRIRGGIPNSKLLEGTNFSWKLFHFSFYNGKMFVRRAKFNVKNIDAWLISLFRFEYIDSHKNVMYQRNKRENQVYAWISMHEVVEAIVCKWNLNCTEINGNYFFTFTQLIPSTSFSRKLSPVILAVVPFRTSEIGNFVESWNSREILIKNNIYIIT